MPQTGVFDFNFAIYDAPAGGNLVWNDSFTGVQVVVGAFSVNVPNPAWRKVAWRSLGGARAAKKPLKYLKKAWRMLRYGAWLKKEARTGRFHYLPADVITAKLKAVGFAGVIVRRPRA